MWKCECGWCGEEPQVCPGVCGGEVVDIIDVFCPSCPANESDGLEFVGTRKEKDEWWDSWFEKQNGPEQKIP